MTAGTDGQVPGGTGPIPGSADATPVGPIRRFIMRYPWHIAIAVGLVAIPASRSCTRFEPPPPPIISSLPSFTLVDAASAKPFGTSNLQGSVWVAGFVFTTCPTTCPAVTRAMRTLQRRFIENEVPVKLVTFTVDPEYDTPERLVAYAKKNSAEMSSWHWLTSTTNKQMEDVVVGGFRTAMGAKKKIEGGMFDIAHTTKLALVDWAGNIRGYYASDARGLDELFHRSQHVLKQQREVEEEGDGG